MNVYFCDVCGVRVTDVDLHSGHGMRRRNDVICAACLELGHGREWAASHAQKPQMALAGAGNGATANGSAGALLPPPPPLDVARDRARTFDEDEPPAPVTPVVLPAASAAPRTSPEAPLEVDDTAQVPVVHQELSAAAAGFAALTPPQVESRGADDDVDEMPASKLDESGGVQVLPGTDVADADDEEEDGDEDAEKTETAVSNRVDEADRPAKDSRNTPGARSKTSSSRVSKTAKSARSKAKKNPNQGQLILLSAAGLIAILVLGSVAIMKVSKGKHTGGDKIENNYSVQLRDAVTSAKKQAQDAIRANELGKLESAHAAIMNVRPIVNKYEELAKRKGYDDEAIGSAVTAFGYNDLLSMDRDIRDKIAIHKQRQK